jgi:capsular polysaccharide biosynthesis protein
MKGRITVARNPVSRVKFSVVCYALLLMVASHGTAAPAQAPPPVTNPAVSSTSGQPSPPAASSQQQNAQPAPQPPASESPAPNRVASTSAATKTLELTDFQRFVAQSLGYPLPIYGTSLFENAPTTFAPVDRTPVTANHVIGPGDEGLKNPSDVFVTMLKSRTVEDALVNRFELPKVYNVKRYQDARKILEKRSEIDPEKEGLISIAVSDRDPKRAADIANAWVDELRSLNQSLALTEAAQRRVFFEQKLAKERDDQATAELVLKQIEQKTGFIQPDAQTRALIGAVAAVRAQIAAKEVQLQSLRTYATPTNPDPKRVQTELAERHGQYARLSRMGGGATSDSSEGNVEVPTGKVTQATLDYSRVARELKYHEALYDFLARPLEAARIDEAKNAVVVQVVDRAVEPERKSSPKRLLIVAITAALSFLLVCFAILVREALGRKKQDPIEAQRLATLNQYLRSSF